jgi:hypothetical protein
VYTVLTPLGTCSGVIEMEPALVYVPLCGSGWRP